METEKLLHYRLHVVIFKNEIDNTLNTESE